MAKSRRKILIKKIEELSQELNEMEIVELLSMHPEYAEEIINESVWIMSEIEEIDSDIRRYDWPYEEQPSNPVEFALILLLMGKNYIVCPQDFLHSLEGFPKLEHYFEGGYIEKLPIDKIATLFG